MKKTVRDYELARRLRPSSRCRDLLPASGERDATCDLAGFRTPVHWLRLLIGQHSIGFEQQPSFIAHPCHKNGITTA